MRLELDVLIQRCTLGTCVEHGLLSKKVSRSDSSKRDTPLWLMSSNSAHKSTREKEKPLSYIMDILLATSIRISLSLLCRRLTSSPLIVAVVRVCPSRLSIRGPCSRRGTKRRAKISFSLSPSLSLLYNFIILTLLQLLPGPIPAACLSLQLEKKTACLGIMSRTGESRTVARGGLKSPTPKS